MKRERESESPLRKKKLKDLSHLFKRADPLLHLNVLLHQEQVQE